MRARSSSTAFWDSASSVSSVLARSLVLTRRSPRIRAVTTARNVRPTAQPTLPSSGAVSTKIATVHNQTSGSLTSGPRVNAKNVSTSSAMM